MSSYHLSPRRFVPVVVLVGVLAIAGCGHDTHEGPSSTTSTTTTSTSKPTLTPSPTEKNIDPTGGNRFTPGVKATPAPNVPPGQHPGINGIP
jgi:hypothetical protein